ncbi:YcfL family protein [Shewanella ulleungensis]|jgi:uncharacterized protein YcfL|uniref:DUF1425 domain-containing protein n=1 Tax=Shewanella ulleungensis TaxID=2282699 RepID=A0ABQ2QIK6_9GAMM|nr:YcfL family protein [Shewanella ulleungensis]MCL1151860.1 YcfL family protein [Shewanella ulleungensis]GGP83582.1 hypothetical protein GCM10009410_16050 [Shewanella ulleungensis]|tara:strand:- start:8521 stop:8913 length:393 start_codon:yes stop_codon:yes gene_type:complete
MKLTSIILFASTLLLGACAHNTAGIAVDSTGQVRVDSSSFASDINVTDISSIMVADLIKASALIQSKTSTDFRVQYKFTWFDANGYTIEDEASSWKSVKLHGMQQLQVSAVAPNTQATHFEIYVRETYSY